MSDSIPRVITYRIADSFLRSERLRPCAIWSTSILGVTRLRLKSEERKSLRNQQVESRLELKCLMTKRQFGKQCVLITVLNPWKRYDIQFSTMLVPCHASCLKGKEMIGVGARKIVSRS